MGRFATHIKLNVSSKKLLTTLKENREKHLQNYKTAVDLFKGQSLSLLESRISALKENQIKDLSQVLCFNLPVPVSYVQAYDEVIKMLEFSEQQEVEIDGNQYRAWVEDQWDWSHSFGASTLSYVEAAGMPVGAPMATATL